MALFTEGFALEVVVGQHAEGWDDVLTEVLVLIVAPDDHEVGVEGVQLLADAAETGDQPSAVFQGRFVAFVLAVLDAHGFGPTAGVFHLLGHVLVVLQGALEGNVLIFVGPDERWVMSKAEAENFCHFVTFRYERGAGCA